MKMNKRILYLIQQAGSLLRMPRSHNRSLGTSFDTIASHSHHVAIIAYCLCRMEKLSHEKAMEAVSMAVFHDLAEARTGDLDFIAKNYNREDEGKAIKDQFKNIEFGQDLEKLLEEYDEKETLVSRCVKDADSLAQVYQEWVLSWQGNKLAEQWFKGDFVERVPNLYTKSAQKLAYSLKESNPNEWWWIEFVAKNGKAKTKEHLLGKNHARNRVKLWKTSKKK